MLRKASEVRFTSDEQITDAVQAALELVEALEVPEDLRAVVFTFAASNMVAKHVELEAVQINAGGMVIPRG